MSDVEFNAPAWMRIPRPVISCVMMVPDAEIAQQIANVAGIYASISENPAHLYLTLGAMQAVTRAAYTALDEYGPPLGTLGASDELRLSLLAVEECILMHAKPPDGYAPFHQA